MREGMRAAYRGGQERRGEERRGEERKKTRDRERKECERWRGGGREKERR